VRVLKPSPGSGALVRSDNGTSRISKREETWSTEAAVSELAGIVEEAVIDSDSLMEDGGGDRVIPGLPA
jgi:hypothetical protein